jgi:hypothetical protein
MRQMISGLVAAAAVMVAAPAMACGFSPCGLPEVYVSPAPAYSYSGCNPCGWAHERLADPVYQYYYVNQGPTYTGPGNWAPQPTYQESAIPGYYHPHHHYRRWHHTGYYHAPRYHYGYAPHHAYAPYHYGHHVLRRYY